MIHQDQEPANQIGEIRHEWMIHRLKTMNNILCVGHKFLTQRAKREN